MGFPSSKAQYTAGGAGCPLVGGIAILSPLNSTYSSSSALNLNISVNGMLSPSIYNYDVVYSLDGAGNVSLPVTASFVPVEATDTYPDGTSVTVTSPFFSYYLINGSVQLPSLPDGSHCLKIYADYVRFNNGNGNWPALIYGSNSVNFTVNSGISPVITNLSITNSNLQRRQLDLELYI